MIQVSEHNGYTIFEDDGATPDFYCRVGRFFASKQVVKELEGPMFDDEHYVWLLAIKDGKIAGFSSCRFDEIGKGIAYFGVTYILPEHRRKGLYRHMFQLKERLCIKHKAKVVRGIANPTSKKVFDDCGWTVQRQAGKWTYYQKEVKHE